MDGGVSGAKRRLGGVNGAGTLVALQAIGSDQAARAARKPLNLAPRTGEAARKRAPRREPLLHRESAGEGA